MYLPHSCVALVLALLSSLTVHARTLDEGWRFFRGDVAHAERPALDDSGWQAVSLPHDWSIAGPFAATNKTGGAGAFAPAGVAWYRKAVSLGAEDAGREVFVEFDGVMQNSEVWINGHPLGRRPNGYVSFGYSLTPYLNVPGDNVIAVRCDTKAQPASRWYSGGGIYRHVRLVATDPVHIERDGVFVTTPSISSAQALVRVQTDLANQSAESRQVKLETTLLSPKGKPVGAAVTSLLLEPSSKDSVRQDIVIAKPQLWDTAAPQLYHAVTKIVAEQAVLDEKEVAFGIRSAHFSADAGFVLNGRKVLLKGVCLHHDGGAFGAAVPLSVWEDRLTTLRSLGVNAIRTAHNPPAPEFLDLCDRMGFLVMDEFFDCWNNGKNEFDYHLFFKDWSKRDAADIVRRDRNHPSVVLWSIGNEIRDTGKPKLAVPIAIGLVEVCHNDDPTRPVTQALFRPNSTGDYTNGLADALDVIGTNYRDNELLAAQRDKPERAIVGTEQRHDRDTWLNLRDNNTHSGQFLWTGVDYLGEAKKWPRFGHASGLLDRTGLIKPMAFERQSWWGEQPMVRLARRVAPDDKLPKDPGFGGEELHTQVQFADWTPRNPEPHEESVEAYSNCEEVELFLNGQSLGVQPSHPDASPRVWKVPFASGSLKAVARNAKGKAVATDELRTAGEPAAIKLETRNQKLGTSWDDVAVIRATVVDAHGVAVPSAADLIQFSVHDPGVIAATDNGDNLNPGDFTAADCKAYHGACTVFVRATGKGKLKVTAVAEGLKPGTLSLSVSGK